MPRWKHVLLICPWWYSDPKVTCLRLKCTNKDVLRNWTRAHAQRTTAVVTPKQSFVKTDGVGNSKLTRAERWSSWGEDTAGLVSCSHHIQPSSHVQVRLKQNTAIKAWIKKKKSKINIQMVSHQQPLLWQERELQTKAIEVRWTRTVSLEQAIWLWLFFFSKSKRNLFVNTARQPECCQWAKKKEYFSGSEKSAREALSVSLRLTKRLSGSKWQSRALSAWLLSHFV